MVSISNDFWHKTTIDNFDPYNILLAIATNIAVLLLCSRVTFLFVCGCVVAVVGWVTRLAQYHDVYQPSSTGPTLIH